MSKRPAAESIPLCCNASVQGGEHFIKNKIFSYSLDESWEDVLKDLLEDSDFTFGKADTVDVCLTSSLHGIEAFHPDMTEQIFVALTFDKSLKYVRFIIHKFCPDTEKKAPKSQNDAFKMMMTERGSCTKAPTLKDQNGPRFKAKDKLYNDLVNQMVTEKAFFPNSMFNSTIEKHVGVIVNALWYIDGSKDKFETRCQKDPSYSIPTRFLNSYCDYNDWRKHKKKAPVLSAATLKLHSSLLFDVLSLPCTTTWNNFKTDLIHLSQSLNSYSAYLDKSNEEQKQRQGIEHLVREVAKNAFLSHVPSVSIVDRKYSILDSAMLKLDYYEYLYLDEDIHVSIEDSLKTSWSRYSFLQNLKLSQPINKLSYNPGGSVGSTVFIWKVPQQRGINEVMNDALKVIDTLKPKLPEYHTRRMRRDFINKYSNFNAVSIPKHILRSIYSDLTMDATSDQNPAMDSRVRHAILSCILQNTFQLETLSMM